MNFKDVAKAAELAEQLTKLQNALKQSWYSGERMTFRFVTTGNSSYGSHTVEVEVPMMQGRVALESEIKRVGQELADLGVESLPKK